MKCPLCDSTKFYTRNISTQDKKRYHNLKLFECLNCSLVFLEDYQKDRSYIYNDNYAAWNKSKDDNESLVAQSKKKAFCSQLKNIVKYFDDFKDKKILDVGTGNGYLLDEAKKLGFDCYGLDISNYSVKIASEKFPGKIYCGTLIDSNYKNNYFDIITITDFIEHISDPKEIFKELKRILKPKGYLFIISPNVDSITRKILGKEWFQYKYEHVLYYNKKSLNYLLQNFNFELKKFKNNSKKFSLNYYYYYFQKYSFLGIGRILSFIYPIIPNFVKNFYFPNPITGEFLAIAKKK